MCLCVCERERLRLRLCFILYMLVWTVWKCMCVLRFSYRWLNFGVVVHCLFYYFRFSNFLYFWWFAKSRVAVLLMLFIYYFCCYYIFVYIYNIYIGVFVRNYISCSPILLGEYVISPWSWRFSTIEFSLCFRLDYTSVGF